MKRAAAQVGVAASVVAIIGLVALILASRWLGPEEYTRFAVFWALLFVLIGTLGGASQEVIRVARVAKLALDAGIGAKPVGLGTPRIVLVTIIMGVATAVLVLLIGLLVGPWLLGVDWLSTVILLSLAGLLVGGALGVGSTVAGLAQWRTYMTPAVSWWAIQRGCEQSAGHRASTSLS